jgi:hypothetical protein
MRYLLAIFLAAFVFGSCVKKTSKDPIPELEYKDFKLLGRIGSDSAVFTIGYKDWDGDLFRNDNSDGPNTVLSTYIYSADSGKFIFDKAFSYAITQPADGYYKGKSIQGDIYIPVSEFRSNPQNKILKFEIFMVDMKDNKSNVVTTPQFTLN